ncbi:hypothetical protein BGZ54_003056, partial [Gamsiella multidivaricata]
MSAKRAALDDLKTWKENKSRAALFWLGRKQALAIKKGKSVVGTSLVDAAANELPNIIQNKASCNNLPDPFAEEDATSSPSTWTSSSRSTEKRTAAQTPQTSNKKRSGITMARGDYVGVEEDLDSDEAIDEHDDTSDETVVDGLKVTKSTGAGNGDKTVASDNDDDDDQDEEDGKGEETVEGLIQDLQALEEEPEPGTRGAVQEAKHKPQLSICQSFLYDYVWNRLDTFLELPTVEKKDVFAAISGIVDLDVHKDFPQHADLLSECRAAIELEYPKIRDRLQTYRQFVDDDDGLKEARLGELMKQLKEDMSRFEDDTDEMVTIEILRILVKQSMPDKYEGVEPTETSTLYVWFSIWKHLFSSTAVD